jgi:hypothetical protein
MEFLRKAWSVHSVLLYPAVDANSVQSLFSVELGTKQILVTPKNIPHLVLMPKSNLISFLIIAFKL